MKILLLTLTLTLALLSLPETSRAINFGQIEHETAQSIPSDVVDNEEKAHAIYPRRKTQGKQKGKKKGTKNGQLTITKPGKWKLYKLDMEKYPLATCLDGSPGAYYIRRGAQRNFVLGKQSTVWDNLFPWLP